MAAYKSGAFVRSKYYTPFYKTPLKWIPRSKSGASKSRPLWAAHTRIGNVWEYPPRNFDLALFTDRTIGMTSFSIDTNRTIDTNEPSEFPCTQPDYMRK